MPKAVYVVNSQPTSPEQEDAYNTWYDDVHVPDICALPGVTGATRYKLEGEATGGVPSYLAIYHFDSDDLQGVLDSIMNGVGDGSIAMSDAIQLDPPPITNLYIERS